MGFHADYGNGSQASLFCGAWCGHLCPGAPPRTLTNMLPGVRSAEWDPNTDRGGSGRQRRRQGAIQEGPGGRADSGG